MDVATLIGLEPMKNPEHVETIGGICQAPSEPVYFHHVKLYLEAGYVITIYGGFCKKLVPAGILGRLGFFDNFKVTFDHSVHPPEFEIEKISKAN